MSSARERIIDATLTLVGEHGMAGVTMVAVAQAAGVARATLYNHYPDVPSILTDAAAVHNEQAIDGLRHALAVVSSPPQAIEQLVRYIGSISRDGHTLTTHHTFPPELRGRLATFDTELEHQIEQALTDGIAAGDFRPGLDTGVTATLLRHALTGVSELVAATPERTAHIVDHAATALLAAIITADQKDPR